MSNDDKIEVEGVVTESLPGGKFRVKIDGVGNIIECTTSGRLKKNFIRTIIGDKVTVNMSPYDLTKGIIVWRDK